MFTWLALGDSYTIGEGVKKEESYPLQTAAILRGMGILMSPPEIIAKTGWTTDELEQAIHHSRINSVFDVVSLLIGVNNQYRGESLDSYKDDFARLLGISLQFAGRHNNHVFVLSIPDWGVTPFAEGRNRSTIAREIDQFNQVNENIAEEYKVNYLNITPATREAGHDPSLLVADRLHPSAIAYRQWAVPLAAQMKKILQ